MLYVGPELLMPLASAAVAAAGAVLMFGRRVMDRLRAAGSALRRPFARARRPSRGRRDRSHATTPVTPARKDRSPRRRRRKDPR